MHLHYNGRCRRCVQGHDRLYASVAVAKCLAIALRRAKGWDGGKTNCRATTKASFEMKCELPEERPQLSGEPLNRFSPSGFIEQRGVVTCRNAPCLKLGVRKRKRTFSLESVCDPVFYFPIGGSRSREG